ncbi:hypothetical protein ACFWUW_02370 [Streptomyces sp. NPDC058655]|uniref:hypothetical protein n=1 Tax=Streptomyces sp. NPDC058655 TaxID=3346577 RepID=UPI0036560C4C
MTEILTEPQAPLEESTPTPQNVLDPADTTSTNRSAKQLEHTPGGFPVVPLSLSGANGTAGLVATAALAGGPVAAMVAMTGAAVLGTVAARHSKNATAGKGKPGSKPGTTPGKAAGSPRTKGGTGGLLGKVPAQPRGSSRAAGKGTGTAVRSGTGAAGGGPARHRAKTPAGGRAGASRTADHTRRIGTSATPGAARQKASQALGALAGGRAGQVRDLRAQNRTGSPSRAAQREAGTQARRQVADSRRATRAAGRAASGSSPAKARGVAARTLAKGMSKAAALRDKTVGAARTAKDRSAGRTVGAGRDRIRQAARQRRLAQAKAPARQAARKALLRSAARFHARRALAAVLGGAAGLLGMVTTPLGRWLGWGWLINPGRRLYRYLVSRALAWREDRDADIRNQLEDDEQAAEAQVAAEDDQDAQDIGDQAARPTTQVPAPPTSQGAHVSNVSGFRFEELAAEMEQAAQSYEPENCMEILAMLEGLPEALQAIANILRILAERSDSEFPLEKVVADMLSDLYGVFANSVDFSEELGPTFRMAHEADIARHEDPRNGHEAEKGWNV